MKACTVMLILFNRQQWGFLSTFLWSFSKIIILKEFPYTAKKLDTLFYLFLKDQFTFKMSKSTSKVNVIQFIIIFLNIFLSAVHVTLEKLPRNLGTSVKKWEVLLKIKFWFNIKFKIKYLHFEKTKSIFLENTIFLRLSQCSY